MVNNPYPVIWCSDWKWNVKSFSQLDRYRRRLETIAPHTKLSPFWSDVASCLNWQGPVSNPQHRLRISGNPPILVATARYDVGTPAAWNHAAAQQIPQSIVLEYEGVGHGQFRNSVCAHDKIVKYLIELKMPPPGTRCAPRVPDATARPDGLDKRPAAHPDRPSRSRPLTPTTPQHPRQRPHPAGAAPFCAGLPVAVTRFGHRLLPAISRDQASRAGPCGKSLLVVIPWAASSTTSRPGLSGVIIGMILRPRSMTSAAFF
ncbi:hypothetical protein FHR32_001488 [Streptosporangium album]|uniref:Peptidase S33 tripeptidyl aminopeptidase-like C-terminal domain-containing protein n=1 Tax=Streptosporangium album TaxID=47479 RepID=A0A7W7W7T3_9ACTN|nr:alpha/beta hydrolase [Streptosporangium album]MBB4937183.1 hypothetical protein [Streptosporangium album]